MITPSVQDLTCKTPKPLRHFTCIYYMQKPKSALRQDGMQLLPHVLLNYISGFSVGRNHHLIFVAISLIFRGRNSQSEFGSKNESRVGQTNMSLVFGLSHIPTLTIEKPGACPAGYYTSHYASASSCSTPLSRKRAKSSNMMSSSINVGSFPSL